MGTRGFTLVEVLVTLLIISLMLSAIYTCFVGTVKAKQHSEEVKDAGRSGQALMTLMRRDFEAAFAFSAAGPAMETRENSIGAADADEVNLVTTSDSRRAVDGRGADYNEVGYILRPNEERDGLLKLYRREDQFVDDSPFAGGTLELLDDEIKSLKFDYLSRQGWSGTWQDEGLPQAVRITLVLRKESGTGSGGEPRACDYRYGAVVLVPAGCSW